jgi:peptidoglycan/xylan/chitin deacetylase (PgdA/CDA1 family)
MLNVPNQKALLAKVIDAGHEIAAHSYTHGSNPDGTSRPIAKEIYIKGKLTDVIPAKRAILEEEINQSVNELEAMVGHKVKFFRLPYGAGAANIGHNKEVIRKMIKDRDMVHAYWNVDSMDWYHKQNYERTVKTALDEINLNEKAGRGQLILFHDVHEFSPLASKLVMEELKKRKYRFVTMSQIANELNGK